MDAEPVAELRMAIQQNQPIGDRRFYAQIEAETGQRRELKRRGRPRKRVDPDAADSAKDAGAAAQQTLGL